MSVDTIRSRVNSVKSHFWDHFTRDFDSLNPHTLHYLCPYSRCVTDHVIDNLSCDLYHFIVTIFLAVGISLQTFNTPYVSPYLHLCVST